MLDEQNVIKEILQYKILQTESPFYNPFSSKHFLTQFTNQNEIQFIFICVAPPLQKEFRKR